MLATPVEIEEQKEDLIVPEIAPPFEDDMRHREDNTGQQNVVMTEEQLGNLVSALKGRYAQSQMFALFGGLITLFLACLTGFAWLTSSIATLSANQAATSANLIYLQQRVDAIFVTKQP